VLIDSDVLETDPRYEGTAAENKVSRLCAAGLTAVDRPGLEPRLLLAEAISSPDPLTWLVTLRADARFADGSPVTADDVAFTYASMLDPAMKSPKRRAWEERFVAVEAAGARQVRFRLKQPIATFLSDIDFGIVSRAAAGPTGRYPGGLTLGAGAYRPVSLRTGEVVLAANPYYVEGAPPTPRLVVRTVKDANARLLMLVGGSADFTQNTVRMDLIDEVSARPRLHAASGASAILSYLMFQNQDPILRDVRVRHAIALAIDRDQLIRRKLSGRAVRATGLLPPSHWAYSDEHVARWDFDPAAARALLDAAGYPDPPGPRPRFSLTYKTSSDVFRVSVARLIAQMLGEVGIAVEVRPFEFATFLADIKKGAFQLASMQTADIGEPDMYWVYFHSTRIPDASNADFLNRWRYRSTAADRLIEAGRHELDRVRRRTVYAELQRLLAEDLPILPLWHEDNIAVMNRDVQGYQVVPNARLTPLARTRKQASGGF
jgi:peptide/nickel transport system substrate-binding protein